MFMPRRRSSNAYDVKDSDAALESFNPVQKAQKAESSFSAIVRTRSDGLPSVSQRQLQRKRTSEVDVGFALARDEHKKKNRRIDLTSLARVLGNRSYEDNRVLLNPRKRSKNDDFQGHSSASLIENEVKLQSPPVLLGLKRAGIPGPKVARGVAKRGYHTTSHISNGAESAQAVAERTNPSISPTVSTINPPPTTTHPGGKMNNANFPDMMGHTMTQQQQAAQQQAAQQQQNILNHYRSQQTPMGWQQTCRPEDRTRIAQQLSTSFRLAKPDAPDREALEWAITVENDRFSHAASKDEYNTAIKERMYALQQARQRNVDLPQQGNNQAGTANEFTVIAKSPPAVSIHQQPVSVTYKTGPLEIFKETEPALCIKYTISEDMTKGEQTRNKARLSAIADRQRPLGSKRLSALGFAHGRTGIEAHRNHGTLLLKDRSGFSVPSREDLLEKALR